MHFPRYWSFVTGIHRWPLTDGFPSQRQVTLSLGIFFDQRLNKGFSKQSKHRWFEETPSRHYDVTVMDYSIESYRSIQSYQIIFRAWGWRQKQAGRLNLQHVQNKLGPVSRDRVNSPGLPQRKWTVLQDCNQSFPLWKGRQSSNCKSSNKNPWREIYSGWMKWIPVYYRRISQTNTTMVVLN